MSRSDLKAVAHRGWGTSDNARVAVVHEDPRHVRMRAEGDFDLSNADLLTLTLLAQLCGRCRAVSVDMSAVDFIDVVAVEALLATQRTFRSLGATLLLTDPSRPVSRLLRLTGLESELTAPPAAPPRRR